MRILINIGLQLDPDPDQQGTVPYNFQKEILRILQKIYRNITDILYNCCTGTGWPVISASKRRFFLLQKGSIFFFDKFVAKKTYSQ